MYIDTGRRARGWRSAGENREGGRYSDRYGRVEGGRSVGTTLRGRDGQRPGRDGRCGGPGRGYDCGYERCGGGEGSAVKRGDDVRTASENEV